MENQIIFYQIRTDDLFARIDESVRRAIEGALLPKESVKSDICDLEEAEKITGIKKAALYKLSMDKFRVNDPHPLPCYKSGKFLRFNRAKLQDWSFERLKPKVNISEGVSLELAKSALRKR